MQNMNAAYNSSGQIEIIRQILRRRNDIKDIPGDAAVDGGAALGHAS
jgi:hypothetical protein